VRQSPGDVPLPDGPGRAADELRHLANAERFTEFVRGIHGDFALPSLRFLPRAVVPWADPGNLLKLGPVPPSLALPILGEEEAE
jgi:hypothetical protein